MAILQAGEKSPEISGTASGRSFFTDGGLAVPNGSSEESVTPDAELRDLREPARIALRLLNKLETYQALIATAAACPGTVSETVLDETRAKNSDIGVVWRQQTDTIGQSIAAKFPNQTIAGSFFDTDSAAHVSDSKTLYRVVLTEPGQMEAQEPAAEAWAFASVISQDEHSKDIGIATNEMWLELLAHIITIT